MSKGATIQLWRGVEADLPTLADGEPGWCLDTYTLFVGAGGVNRQVGGTTIGSAVGGSPTDGSVLFVDVNGKLAQDAGVFFYDADGSLGSIGVPALYVGPRLALKTGASVCSFQFSGGVVSLNSASFSAIGIESSNGFTMSGGAAVFGPSATNTILVTIVAHAFQSAPLQIWEPPAGGPTLFVDYNARLFIKTLAAPADDDVGTSSLTFWLDDTPGATKVMFKAKDSGGTVRTGSVNLA